MSRLKSLLRVSSPSTCNTQQNPVQVCKPVAQQTHSTQQEITHAEENEIKDWLDQIDENDPTIRDHVINQCRLDQSVRAYFLRHARGEYLH